MLQSNFLYVNVVIIVGHGWGMLHSTHCYVAVGTIVFSGISVGLGRNVCVIYAEIVHLTFFFWHVLSSGIVRLKCDGTCAETRFRLSPKRTSPFKSAGAWVQSTAVSRGVRISGSNDGYTVFRSSVRVMATHSIRQFLLHFPSRASPYAIRFHTHSNSCMFVSNVKWSSWNLYANQLWIDIMTELLILAGGKKKLFLFYV